MCCVIIAVYKPLYASNSVYFINLLSYPSLLSGKAGIWIGLFLPKILSLFSQTFSYVGGMQM